MNFRVVRMTTIMNGLTAGISGGLAAVIQQGIGNASSGSFLSVAVGGAAGAYVAVMLDLIRQWFSKRCRNRRPVPQSSFADNLNERDAA